MSSRRAIAFAAVMAVTAFGAQCTPRQGIDFTAIHRIDRDVRLAAILDRLRGQGRTGTVVFSGITAIDPAAGQAVEDRSVVVRDGRIDWVGPTHKAPTVEGAYVVDGRGKFLSPGLADMHVHTQGVGEHILRLAAGVTTVREMVGFPWHLRLRDAIEHDRVIGSTMHVAGTIISDHPLDGYAVVVRTPEQVRGIVAAQRVCGYAFIKVHNRLDRHLFDAVADEAKRQQLDLVGHVPHDITLRHAIQSAHMRTLEHLKGFLLDQTLLPSTEDFANALAGANVWIDPTLYTRLSRAYGAEAARLGADPRLRFAPRSDREAWMRDIPSEGSERALLGDTYVRTQQVVMARLVALNPKWLAGSDAAGYAFNIAGFALHDELQMMHDAGVPIVEILRAATTNAAAAMRQNDFGGIAAGMRADLILLNANPLIDLGAFQTNDGVMVRGRWLDRRALDTALDALANIYDEPPPGSLDRAAASAIASATEAAISRGHVFETSALTAAAQSLKAADFDDLAAKLERLADRPTSGPCAADWPT